MANLNNILAQIFKLTAKIETKYPELYKYLGENPVTIPSEDHPDINLTVMKNYLESLKSLLKHHIETHNNNINLNPQS